MIARLAVLMTLGATAVAAAQTVDIARRVTAAPDGQVRFSYAAREGVYGNGGGSIAWGCRNEGGRCRQTRNDDDESEWQSPCDTGPVRVSLTVHGGTVTSLRAYVGGQWRSSTGATDLGTVSTRDATRYLLDLATHATGRAGHEAIFAATLADSVTIWPDLLKIARNATIQSETRKQAVFWLGQAAGDAVTKDLSDLVDDTSLDVEVKKSAVFALSQLPHDDGVPALIAVVRNNHSGEVRKNALFWLGQSGDPRALALFEEILTRP